MAIHKWLIIITLPVLAAAFNCCCFHHHSIGYDTSHHPRRCGISGHSHDNQNHPAVVVILPLENALSALQHLLGDTITKTIVQIEGYVIAKRVFGRNLCFFDIADAKHYQTPVPVILKRQDFLRGDDDEYFDGIFRCILDGVRLRIIGTPIQSNSRKPLLSVQDVQIIGLPRNPQHTRILLHTVANGLLPYAAITQATNRSETELKLSIAPAIGSNDNNSNNSTQQEALQTLQTLAKEILRTVPSPPEYPNDILSKKNQKHKTFSLSAIETVFRNPPNFTSIRHESFGSILLLLQGTIQNRQRLLNNVTLLELKMDTENDNGTIMLDHSQNQQRKSQQLLLHPSVLPRSNMFGNILAPGARVRIRGHALNESGGIQDDSESIVWVTQIQLLQACWSPSTIQYMIKLMTENLLRSDEVSQALNMSQADIMDIIDNTRDRTALQWKASEIAKDLQWNSKILKASVTPAMNRILDSYKDLRRKYPIQATQWSPAEVYDRDKRRDGSRWNQKKEPQLAWMTHEIERIVQSHPDYGQRPLTILDIGGGKGLLANHIAQKLDDSVEIIVVDVARGAIRNGAMKSRRFNLSVEYMVADASDMILSRKIDVVVALRKYMDCIDQAKNIYCQSKFSKVLSLTPSIFV
jgi:hypothetical protein